MNLDRFKKLAISSTVVLGIAYGSGAFAAAGDVQIGSPTTVGITATVENTINVVVTALAFGTVGAIRDTVDVATFTVNPDSSIVEDPGTGYGGSDPAAIVNDPTTTPAAALITVTAAFNSTELYVTYQNIVDPTAGAGNTFELSALVDDLATPGAYNGTTDTMTTIGHGTTSITGGLVFHVGGSISTTTGSATAYADGAYPGSFDIVFSY